VGDTAIARRNGEVHKADRLAGLCAAGTCNACDRYREVNIGVFERAKRHRSCGLFADCAESIDCRQVNAEHRVLGGVGVGDVPALDHVGRARNVGEGGCDHSARAGFGSGDGELAHPAKVQQ
jgi:hypothetical protein